MYIVQCTYIVYEYYYCAFKNPYRSPLMQNMVGNRTQNHKILNRSISQKAVDIDFHPPIFPVQILPCGRKFIKITQNISRILQTSFQITQLVCIINVIIDRITCKHVRRMRWLVHILGGWREIRRPTIVGK